MNNDSMSESESFLEWVWVAGYSSLTTLVIIFNAVLFFSVGKNSYLHYSTHYTVLALAIRNMMYMLMCICILLLTKLERTPDVKKAALQHSDQEGKLLCEILSALDTFLSSLLSFYLVGLAVYMFCRSPNPNISSASETTLKMYGLTTKAIPVRESGWQAPILLLLPALCALLLAIPAPLLHMPHALSVIQDREVCTFPFNLTYQTSVATLSSALPILTLVLLLIGLSVRRCLTCKGGDCISSFCKEEIFLTLMSILYSVVSIGKHLPLLDIHLKRMDLAPTGLHEFLSPALFRGLEATCCLLLPLLLYCLLPPYRRFSSKPDSSDLYQSKRDIYRSGRNSYSSGDPLSDEESEDAI